MNKFLGSGCGACRGSKPMPSRTDPAKFKPVPDVIKVKKPLQQGNKK